MNNFMLKKILAILILPIFILSCSKEVQKIENSKFLFGTYISITVYDKDEKLANRAIEAAFQEIERIDNKFNSKVKGSIIDNLNSGKEKIENLGYHIGSAFEGKLKIKEKTN